jgi:hypothetical protein
MKMTIAVPAALLTLAFLGPGAAAETSLHGTKLAGLEPSKLEDVLARPEAGKSVRLEGTIEKVCESKGCWLELKQGTQSVHVTFAGYSFFVPKDTAGQPVVLEGRVIVKEPKPADVEHKQSEGAGAAVAAKVSIEATGVEITR